LERSREGARVTQYDMHALEKLGLVKIDLLGNRALAAQEMAVAMLPARPAMPDRDPATLATLQAAETIGCFQLETPVLRSMLQQVHVSGIDDLIAVLAIVRPGPRAGEARAAFVRRMNREEEPRPPHPRLGGLLAQSHGLLLYEEDVIEAVAAMTGRSRA